MTPRQFLGHPVVRKARRAKAPVVRIQTLEHIAMDEKPRYWFRIVAANHQVLVTSEMYIHKASRDKTVRLLARAKLQAP